MQKSSELYTTIWSVVLLHVPAVSTAGADRTARAAISTASTARASIPTASTACAAISTTSTTCAAISTTPARRVPGCFRKHMVSELLPDKKKGIDNLE